MGCPSDVYIGGTIVLAVKIHDPATGELTDADSPPVYRVYEGTVTPPILIGTTSKLDDANTVGQYADEIVCSLGNGFEVDKAYTAGVVATVNGADGGASYGWIVKQKPWDAPVRTLTMTGAEVVAALVGSELTIRRGDTYSATLIGLGMGANVDRVWFTIKAYESDPDAESQLQLEWRTGGSAGITYINEAAAGTAESALGSLTPNFGGSALGILIHAGATKELTVVDIPLIYDVQVRDTGGTVTTVTQEKVTIEGVSDVTRRIA